MGLFRRSKPAVEAAVPPPRGACACREHVEELAGLVVPASAELAEEDLGDMTVGDLVDMGALGVDPDDLAWFTDQGTGKRLGPFHWRLWLGDEVRGSYDDDADLGIDESLRRQPGIDLVDWEDREVFHVSSPTLCADGVLAAAARALLDPAVRRG